MDHAEMWLECKSVVEGAFSGLVWENKPERKKLVNNLGLVATNLCVDNAIVSALHENCNAHLRKFVCDTATLLLLFENTVITKQKTNENLHKLRIWLTTKTPILHTTYAIHVSEAWIDWIVPENQRGPHKTENLSNFRFIILQLLMNMKAKKYGWWSCSFWHLIYEVGFNWNAENQMQNNIFISFHSAKASQFSFSKSLAPFLSIIVFLFLGTLRTADDGRQLYFYFE